MYFQQFNINLFQEWRFPLKFTYLLDLVCLDRVVEVRCGQQTKNFVKFPYTEVESQSFSLMFEKQQGNTMCIHWEYINIEWISNGC